MITDSGYEYVHSYYIIVYEVLTCVPRAISTARVFIAQRHAPLKLHKHVYTKQWVSLVIILYLLYQHTSTTTHTVEIFQSFQRAKQCECVYQGRLSGLREYALVDVVLEATESGWGIRNLVVTVDSLCSHWSLTHKKGQIQTQLRERNQLVDTQTRHLTGHQSCMNLRSPRIHHKPRHQVLSNPKPPHLLHHVDPGEFVNLLTGTF